MVQTSSNRFEPEPNQNHRFSSGFGHMARTEPGVQFGVRKFYPLNRTEPNFSITTHISLNLSFQRNFKLSTLLQLPSRWQIYALSANDGCFTISYAPITWLDN